MGKTHKSPSTPLLIARRPDGPVTTQACPVVSAQAALNVSRASLGGQGILDNRVEMARLDCSSPPSCRCCWIRSGLIFSRGEVQFPVNRHKRTRHQPENPLPSSRLRRRKRSVLANQLDARRPRCGLCIVRNETEVRLGEVGIPDAWKDRSHETPSTENSSS